MSAHDVAFNHEIEQIKLINQGWLQLAVQRGKTPEML
jgi:hypothetical protein